MAKTVDGKRMKKQTDIALGKRIAKLRRRFGFKRQEDFAAALGVTRAAVGNWERGAGCGLQNIRLVCEQFNVSPDWLMIGRGEMIRAF